MTSIMTEEDSISLAPLLEERHDTYKGYLVEYIRQPETQVGRNLVLFYFLVYYNWQICRVRAQYKRNVRLCDGVFVVSLKSASANNTYLYLGYFGYHKTESNNCLRLNKMDWTVAT